MNVHCLAWDGWETVSQLCNFAAYWLFWRIQHFGIVPICGTTHDIVIQLLGNARGQLNTFVYMLCIHAFVYMRVQSQYLITIWGYQSTLPEVQPESFIYLIFSHQSFSKHPWSVFKITLHLMNKRLVDKREFGEEVLLFVFSVWLLARI